MKKLFSTLAVLLLCNLSYAQIPAINENNKFIKSKNPESAKLSEDIQALSKKISDSKNNRAALLNVDSVSVKILEDSIASDSVKYQKLTKKSENIDPVAAGYDKYYQNKIKILEAEKLVLQKSISTTDDLDLINKIASQIYKKDEEIEQTRDEWKIKAATLKEKYSWFMPSAKRVFRKQFFENTYNNDTDKTNYLNSFTILDDKNSTTVQSELISDYLCFSRIAFGTVITPTKKDESDAEQTKAAENPVSTETTEDALNRLINCGGNFYLEFVVPLVTTYNGKSTDWLTFYSYANLRGATDIKGIGNNIDTSTANGSLGLYAYGSASSESKKFNFFLQGNLNFSFGSNEFYENLDLPNHNGFLHGKLIAGLTLLNTFRLSAIINTVGSNEVLRSGKVVFGIQFLPDLLKK